MRRVLQAFMDLGGGGGGIYRRTRGFGCKSTRLSAAQGPYVVGARTLELLKDCRMPLAIEYGT